MVDDYYWRQYTHVRLIQLEQAGKGLAVRAGMLAAAGQWRVMADADFSMEPSGIRELLPVPGDDPFDIAITTRQGPGAKRYNEPLTRHISGRLFNLVVRTVTGLPFGDTQCGYKSFSARAAEDIFSRCHVDGWAFDVEVLYIAMLRMYTVKELPIEWQSYDDSKIKLFRDAIRMFRDVVTIKQSVDRATVSPLERFA
jgi:dolichyl-phosphate beta-glucosyltransferase